MESFLASIRLVVATMLICVAAYAAVIWGIGQVVYAVHGARIADRRAPTVKSSAAELIAQKFTQPRYFWPRPSAVDYNAAAAGGSNKSPTSPEASPNAPKKSLPELWRDAREPLAGRARGGLRRQGWIRISASMRRSTRQSASPRRAAFHCPQVEAMITRPCVLAGSFMTPDRLVNVLELNLALDKADAAQ